MVALVNIISTLVSFVFLAAQGVFASPTISPIHALAYRQVTAATSSSKNVSAIPADAIPSSCTPQCPSQALTSLTNCTKDACDCNSDTFNAVGSCLDCLVTYKGISTTLSTDLKAEYAATCSARNEALPNVTSGAAAVKMVLMTGVPGLNRVNLGMVGTMVAAAVLSTVV